jgi:hypothetical protein
MIFTAGRFEIGAGAPILARDLPQRQRHKERAMSKTEPSVPETPEAPRPPQFKIPRSLYFVSGGLIALWIGVTFFLRNPYTQAIQGDYYERRSFDDTAMWAVIFVVALMGLGAFISWSRRQPN